ncbi:MAG: prepilin-type N-terminal cleavage/methylation domain-containing protein [Lachnospiraceae bacterium]|nr:prepilin-type N-terminal cleavage/methylation domain-containing protein [Lachnospiraceae bacterium]
MKKSQKGFSIIELIIAVAILGSLSLMVFTMMQSSSNMYSRTSADAALQSESQIVANTISDSLIDCKEVLKEDDAKATIQDDYETGTIKPSKASGKFVACKSVADDGSTVLSRVFFDSDARRLYLVTGTLDDKGTESGTQVSLLAEYVTDFNVDISRFEKERLISFGIAMDKRGVQYQGDYQVYVRNQKIEEKTGDKEEEVDLMKRVSIDPPTVYVDILADKLAGKYYHENPMSDAEKPMSIDAKNAIAYKAIVDGNVKKDKINYEWGVNGGSTGWAQISGSGPNVDLVLNKDGYANADSSYTISLKASYEYDDKGSKKTQTKTAIAKIALRMVRYVTIKQVSSPDFVKWDKIYEDKPYEGHSCKGAEYYLKPGATESFTATPVYTGLNYKTGVTWKLEYKGYNDTNWAPCTEARIASLTDLGAGKRVNTVKLGKDATNDMVFRITATSEFDGSKYAEYIFGVLPTARKSNSIGEYSRGYYTDMTAFLQGKTGQQYAGQDDAQPINKVEFFKVTKIDCAGKEDLSGDKIKLQLDSDGHIRLYVDYNAFAYDKEQKASFYGGSVAIHYTVGFQNTKGKHCINGKEANSLLNEYAQAAGVAAGQIIVGSNDLTYTLKPVKVTKIKPTNSVLVVEKGASRNVTVNTSYYNLSAPKEGVYYFGAYLGNSESKTSDMVTNLLESGKGNLNAYFSVNMASPYGNAFDYVDEATVTVTATASQKNYLTDPITFRLTADDYYKIKVGGYADSYTDYSIITANVDGSAVYFPSFESKSTISGLKWDDAINSSDKDHKITLKGINASGGEESAEVYKAEGKYYEMKYNSKTYRYNTTNHVWKVKN